MKQATCQKEQCFLHKEKKHTHWAKYNSTQVHMVWDVQVVPSLKGDFWDEERNHRSHPNTSISHWGHLKRATLLSCEAGASDLWKRSAHCSLDQGRAMQPVVRCTSVTIWAHILGGSWMGNPFPALLSRGGTKGTSQAHCSNMLFLVVHTCLSSGDIMLRTPGQRGRARWMCGSHEVGWPCHRYRVKCLEC